MKSKANQTHHISHILQLGAGVALTETTLSDIVEVGRTNAFAPAYLSDIVNHELLVKEYTHYDLATTETVDYLRLSIGLQVIRC